MAAETAFLLFDKLFKLIGLIAPGWKSAFTSLPQPHG